MNIKLISALSAAAVITVCACGCTDEAEQTAGEVTSEVSSVINVYGEYAVTEGNTIYCSPDGGFSIHLPEGSTVDDADVLNTAVILPGNFETPDTISITKQNEMNVIKTKGELMDMAGKDSSIEIDGFCVLERDGVYEGYKYSYTAADNSGLKGIVGIYFCSDGSAYMVNATINNGNDSTVVEGINGIVDTFVNNL